MKINLAPIGERIVVKKDEIPGKIGNIIVPRNTREIEATEGVVIAVGPVCCIVKAGDRVLFARYSGAPISERDGEKNLLIMNECDLLAVVETKNNKEN